MIYHILSAVAEYEREHTREKILAALERAKAQGKKLGAPGLNSPKNRRYNPDLIPTIKKHHADGVPIRKIVRLVGLARNTVKAILKESSQTEAEHEAS
jgi:DNA invertase Pin-like site-specific DNA recombinase